MEKIEIILQASGTLTERVIRERDLDAEQSVLEALTEGVTRNLRNVMTIPEWGVVHASVGLCGYGCSGRAMAGRTEYAYLR
jgi:hypothetical protein